MHRMNTKRLVVVEALRTAPEMYLRLLTKAAVMNKARDHSGERSASRLLVTWGRRLAKTVR
jgi:hypothetical protein